MRPSSHHRGRGTRDRDLGVARPAGLAVAAVTAVAVFLIGRALFPRPAPIPPLPPAPAVAPIPPAPLPPPVAETPPLPPAATPTVDAARTDAKALSPSVDAVGAAEEAGATKSLAHAVDDGAAAPPNVPPAAAPAATAPPPETEEPEAEKAGRKEATTLADKDAAREAWRKNRPVITVAGSKASMMIPIKGSIEGAAYSYLPRKRQVIVTLPKATSLNTMMFYRFKRPEASILPTAVPGPSGAVVPAPPDEGA
jgi:pyruvate/2-oxoglutarate dehydrogenase complex dihydrolipoamide acyltransferase (E2) component